jgi:hypothetical protein
MTVKVAGYWELGWSAPLTEADQWAMMLDDFAVVEWYMAPKTGVANTPVIEMGDVQQVLEANTWMVPVFVDERGHEPLRTFEHPVHALYIFGKAGYSPLPLMPPNGVSVCIETTKSAGKLWPHQACAIVLYDRLRKSWR